MPAVTVSQAIRRGRRMTTYAGLALMLLVLTATVLLGITGTFGVWIWPAGTLLSFASLWLVWAVAIPRWKVWAFREVAQVRSLRRRAVAEKLIWPEGHFFERTEIWRSSDKAAWLQLQHRFDRPDPPEVFADDPAVPPVTVIRNSRIKAYGYAALMLFVVSFGVLMALYGHYWQGALIGLIGLWGSVDAIRKARNRQPQITLDAEGIGLANRFFAWKEISRAEVVVHGSGKHAEHRLVFQTRDGQKQAPIQDLSIRPARLERLLGVYRARHVALNP